MQGTTLHACMSIAIVFYGTVYQHTINTNNIYLLTVLSTPIDCLILYTSNNHFSISIWARSIVSCLSQDPDRYNVILVQ